MLNAEFNDLHSSPDEDIKMDEMGGACEGCGGEKGNVYRCVVGKPEEQRSFGRSGGVCKYRIKIDLKETGWKDVNWIHVAQDKTEKAEHFLSNLETDSV
jgi:hypothetical protein